MTQTPNRLERRKAQTRGALISAAQGFIASGELNVPIAEITKAADVGMGSFYNHFESRDQLFQAAVDGALELLGMYLDSLTDVDADPADAFTRSFRISGRLFRLQPELSRVLIHSGPELITSQHGLGPRAVRDIGAGVDAGYFRVPDIQLSLALVAGALLGLGQLLLEQPDRDDAQAVDAMAYSVLLALGVPDDDAQDLCARPLPPMSDVPSVDGERE
ncbi:TetR/AcrR family transcriptional regulator [Rhodococcoides navarretei]|uniref:TetR/AcrR family transcriptional regulator n=1 Tax=Rhodococcus navarretei TaxID=3128981 RepID=A0ABU9CSP9_9NOCA